MARLASGSFFALATMMFQLSTFAFALHLGVQRHQSESAVQRGPNLSFQSDPARHQRPGRAWTAWSPWASMRKKKKTFAVITRVFWAEIPYIKSFIAHYDKLGVERIVLVVTDENSSDEIATYLNESCFAEAVQSFTAWQFSLRLPMYQATIDIHSHPQRTGRQKRRTVTENGGSDTFVYPWGSMQLSDLKLADVGITQDYVIVIDADEYLAPEEEAQSLAHMVAPFPDADIFTFGWVFAPYDGDNVSHDPNYLSYEPTWVHPHLWRASKYMIKTDKLLALGDENMGKHGIHWPLHTTCAPNCTIQNMGNRLVHFHYRGLWDAVTKDMGIFKSEQNEEGATGVSDKFKAFEPSLRQKLMALSCSIARRIGVPLQMGSWTPKLSIDQAAVTSLLQMRFDSDEIRTIPEIYFAFKRVMNYDDVWDSTFARLVTEAPLNVASIIYAINLSDIRASHSHVARS